MLQWEEYHKRVFESVASQTYKNYEWIIINDGSTDKSDSVIRKYISDYNFAGWVKLNIYHKTTKVSMSHGIAP